LESIGSCVLLDTLYKANSTSWCSCTGKLCPFASFRSDFGKKRGVGTLRFPDPLPTCPDGLIHFLASVSLAGKYIPYPVIYELFTEVNGLGVFDAYPAVPTISAKQLVKVLLVKVVNRLAFEVFEHSSPFLIVLVAQTIQFTLTMCNTL